MNNRKSKNTIGWAAAIGLTTIACISVCILCTGTVGGVYYLANRANSPTAKAATKNATPLPDALKQPTDTAKPHAATPKPTRTPKPTTAVRVIITWWHINTAESQGAYWQMLADEYMAAHPNVTIEITATESVSFKNKLTTVMQSGDPPDIFQSWGGGVMNEYAKAGLLRDITPELNADGGKWRNTFGAGALGVYALDGSNYGVPWDMGMAGLWYNKALFAQAGIYAAPATWTEFLQDAETLKTAGITPIAVAAGDRWPASFWWEYLAIRSGGKEAFDAAYNRSGSFADPSFIEAGRKLQELIALSPFQYDFLNTSLNGTISIMANSGAAMELMGQWAPALYTEESVDKIGFGDDLGWFPFPMVEGGAGNPGDALGSCNGFAIGKNAPSEAVDFVKYLTRAESQAQCAQENFCIPAVKGGEAGLTDPLMITLQQALAEAEYVQPYYDQYLPYAMGQVISDSVWGIFNMSLTPEEAAQAIEDSAKQELR
jgi:raffinose/stachyose/melibiose transport system substrate-binding protein